MTLRCRTHLDRAFTVLTGATVVLLSVILLLVLGPMMVRGSSAVVFRGTVEFRKMQLDLFERGPQARLQAEVAEVQAARQPIYDMVDRFKRGIDVETLEDQIKQIHRRFGDEIRNRGVQGDAYSDARSRSKAIREQLREAFTSQDRDFIDATLDRVLLQKDESLWAGTSALGYFTLARDFQEAVARVDLARQHEYAAALAEVEEILAELFGPRPGQSTPLLPHLRYGATRWDQAGNALHRLLWVETWVAVAGHDTLVRRETPRRELFAGTRLEALFDLVPQQIHACMHPRLTFYWQYFFDDSVESHYFGGVGPEILGTLVITLLSMLFVVPLGILSAAYLVECAGGNPVVRMIRMCINTLAGVPSIVFGLFGLSFFVLFLFPKLGIGSKSCILAASLTLAVLTLPVMIRASEEAIRTVPRSYKEGALALGASAFGTFVTVTLPAALPGILTGVILSLSRIAGETAPILFTGAVALGPVPKSVFDPTRTLSYGSYDMAVSDRVAMMVPHNQYGMVVTLIGLILCLNGLAIALRSRVFKKLKGH
jgi:phosphate transport system permease protein